MQVYIVAIRMVAISSPPQPPSARPKFQPGEVAGDDVGDAEPGEQDPARGALLELALLEVVAPDVLASTALLRCPRLRHPSSSRERSDSPTFAR